MTRELLLTRRDYFNLVHGVTTRAIAAFSEHDLNVLFLYLRLLGKEPPNLYDY